MSKTKALKITVIAIRIALGVLFIYAGYQKFIPKERPAVSEVQELPDHVVKIKAFIGGMKQTGYFWPFLGIAEIVAGHCC
jgi:putative oxidoreductase